MSDLATSAQAQDSDRTILMPRPGGRAPPAMLAAGANAGSNTGSNTGLNETPPAPGTADPAAQAQESRAGSSQDTAPRTSAAVVPHQGCGLNPLVQAANPLLDLVVPLRSLTTHQELDALRIMLIDAMNHFQAQAHKAHVDAQTISIARYVLCTFLDETIASTPWGGNGAWSSNSLLVEFHHEAWGGEKFFQILQRLAQEPETHLHLLELMYLCLALGLEGRYRVIDDGRIQVERLRERLFLMIQKQRGPHAEALSVRWQASTSRIKSLWRDLPFWTLLIGMAGILLITRALMLVVLENATNPLIERMRYLPGLVLFQPETPVKAPKPVEKNLPPLSFAHLLAPEITHGFLTVDETSTALKITLSSESLFASGSAHILPIYLPVLDRIADALKTVDGKVSVVGHTDDQRSTSLRIPSNGELSVQRARAVMATLVAIAGKPERFDAEGRGAESPLVPNDGPQNRALNRRVDIIVTTASRAAP